VLPRISGFSEGFNIQGAQHRAQENATMSSTRRGKRKRREQLIHSGICNCAVVSYGAMDASNKDCIFRLLGTTVLGRPQNYIDDLLSEQPMQVEA